MSQTFFTSDLHLNHANILSYCKRPWARRSLSHMQDQLVDRWNSRVTFDDVVYILGDVALGHNKLDTVAYFLKQLQFKEVHLIKGNHDPRLAQIESSGLFRTVENFKELTLNGVTYMLQHFPYQEFEHDQRRLSKISFKPQILIHGHVHQQPKSQPWQINVCADAWNGYPVSLEQIERITQGEKFMAISSEYLQKRSNPNA